MTIIINYCRRRFGKDKSSCYRIAYLLSKGVYSSKILSLTLTNKAASEMKDRIDLIVERSQPHNCGWELFIQFFKNTKD
ncbi:MAG: UvrD-helicase domain-containing protein [Bacteroidales bacterium]|nr:UvrD-helicase domain-containing protein [Bacteroidales bacterium]